jgi:ketosteroid isomerase-like protein
MRSLRVAAVALLFFVCAAGRIAHAQSSAKDELMAIHQADRKAHFARDADALVANVAPEFLQVFDGKIQRISREDLRKRFVNYFQGAEFVAWDDLEAPVIQVSPDGKMGWMAVRLKVTIRKADASGSKISEDTTMSWISTYEKHEGVWQHVANATTIEKPAN